MNAKSDPLRESIVLAGARMIVDRARVKPELENDIAKLAMFDDLVASLDELLLAEKLDDDHPKLSMARLNATYAIARAKALQGGGK